MKNEKFNTHDIKIKVDLDGVLCNFVGYYKQLFGKNSETTPDLEVWKDIDGYGKAKFFEELPWMPEGQTLWKYINDNFINVKILSALGKNETNDKQTSRGKRAWLYKNIPSLTDKDIYFVQNKYQKQRFSGSGCIIIDDAPVIIDNWRAAGGIGILYKSAPQVIDELGKYVYKEI